MQERRRVRKVSTEGGYIPNPYGRDLGLGYRVRTLPLGFLSPTRGTERVVKTIEDRWGIYSTKGGYILSSLREERLGEKSGALLAGETER